MPLIERLAARPHWFLANFDYEQESDRKLIRTIIEEIKTWPATGWASFYVIGEGHYFCFAKESDAALFKLKYGEMDIQHGVLKPDQSSP